MAYIIQFVLVILSPNSIKTGFKLVFEEQ